MSGRDFRFMRLCLYDASNWRTVRPSSRLRGNGPWTRSDRRRRRGMGGGSSGVGFSRLLDHGRGRGRHVLFRREHGARQRRHALRRQRHEPERVEPCEAVHQIVNLLIPQDDSEAEASLVAMMHGFNNPRPNVLKFYEGALKALKADGPRSSAAAAAGSFASPIAGRRNRSDKCEDRSFARLDFPL
jgi:hypothetical protein